MIKLEKVSKSFGKTTALKEVSFQARFGAITGFLGPNGAGKTTTMRLISGYLNADSGELTVNGLHHRHNSLQIRANMGYLPENNPLYPDMTVLEYLFLVARLRQLDALHAKKSVAEMIDLCGLEGRLNQTLGTLSKGYRQRVGLAQAMIHDPEILILDEPTTGLDPNQIGEIKELIRELGSSKTLLLSTHILHQVPELCDEVVILNEGRVVFAGTPKALVDQAGAPRVAWLEINADPEAMQRFFGKEDAVSAIDQQKHHNGFHCFRLEGNFSAENMVGLAKKLHAQNLEISRWAAEPPSLEQVFAGLTARGEV